MLEFKPYNATETKEILKQRTGYAFVDNVWEKDAFELIAAKTAELSDIRTGLYLLRESGMIAEDNASRKITLEHAKKAIAKLDEYHVKNKEELASDEQSILSLIKENKEIKIGDLFKLYTCKGGDLSYKSFQRRVKKLELGNFISLSKTEGGAEGNTTIIRYKKEEKKLTDF